ncbi:hypothetical protein LTR28_012914 [Elasticomyces elasticus]|nr:hypothetical protein LTR28_012914 [Elasticomyces elasticus]
MYGITNDEPPTTQTAAAIFQELCYDNKDQLREKEKEKYLVESARHMRFVQDTHEPSSCQHSLWKASEKSSHPSRHFLGCLAFSGLELWLITGSAGMIIAGWDKRHGGQVYSIPLGGSLHKQPYAIGGSGSTYIYGYCDSNWKEGMTEEEGVAFVKGSLQEAIKWDGSSGGVIRMVVLTAKGAQRHLYLPDNGYTGPGTK